MTLKDLVTDVKFWIAAVIIIAGIVVGVLKYQDVPAKLEKVEVKVEVNEDEIKNVSQTFDKYMMEQRVIQREQNKREELMLELLKK